MTASTPNPSEPAPVVIPAPQPSEPAPRSGWAPWKKRVLRWATGLLVVFALGLLAIWLVQVRPLRQQIAALEQERQSLQVRVEELRAETSRLEGVEAENAALTAAMVELEQHSALWMAKVETLEAQFILASGGKDTEAVEALARADDQLDILEGALTGPQQESIRALRYRLAMAAEEIRSDPFAAQRDLEVLANGLATVEEDLFGS